MKTGIVAFAFGQPKTLLSNQRIAEIAFKKARKLNGRIFTQLDIHIEEGVPVSYTTEAPGNPPPTLRIARGAVQWAKQYGLTELWVVAAKPHLWRALRDVQKAVLEDGARIEVHVCEEIKQWPEYTWFCSESTQERVRSQEAWEKREWILQIMPFWLYKRVAS